VRELWCLARPLVVSRWPQLEVSTWITKPKEDIPRAFKALQPRPDMAPLNPWTGEPFPKDVVVSVAAGRLWIESTGTTLAIVVDLYWCTAVPYVYLRARLTRDGYDRLLPDDLHSELRKIMRNCFKNRADKHIKDWILATRPADGTALDLVDAPGDAPSVLAEFARICLSAVVKARARGIYVTSDLDRIEALCLPCVSPGCVEQPVRNELIEEATSRFGSGAEVPLSSLRGAVQAKLDGGHKTLSLEYKKRIWEYLQLRAWERSALNPQQASAHEPVDPLFIDSKSADPRPNTSNPDDLLVDPDEVLGKWMKEAGGWIFDDSPTRDLFGDPNDVYVGDRIQTVKPVEDAVFEESDIPIGWVGGELDIAKLGEAIKHDADATAAEMKVALAVAADLGSLNLPDSNASTEGAKMLARFAMTKTVELRQRGLIRGRVNSHEVIALLRRAAAGQLDLEWGKAHDVTSTNEGRS